jgi:hypothetical protein
MILDSHVNTKVSSELSANVDKNHPGLVNCTMKPCVPKMHLCSHQFGSFYMSSDIEKWSYHAYLMDAQQKHTVFRYLQRVHVNDAIATK